VRTHACSTLRPAARSSALALALSSYFAAVLDAPQPISQPI
jgi:hypothetical protein